MVTFYDPVRKKDISYHIEGKLKAKWDLIRGGKLEKKDEDRVYIVDGRERTGKSVFALQQAKYIDPSFNIDRVCFSPEEFLKCIATAKKGQAIVFDEAFRGLSSKGSQSKVNKKIVQAMMEMGQRNLTIFIVLPTIFLLEIYAAVLRSNVLFRIVKDPKSKVRKIKLYNEYKKNQLYHTGKKKGFSYAFPRIRPCGSFFNIYAIDEAIYRQKKLDSLQEDEKRIELSDRDTTHMKQRDFFIYQDIKRGKTQLEVEKTFKKSGFPLSKRQIGKIWRKEKENREKVMENEENSAQFPNKKSIISDYNVIQSDEGEVQASMLNIGIELAKIDN